MVHHPTNPPTKQKAWWNQFGFVQKKKDTAVQYSYLQPHDPADHPVFGKPLKDSLRYASVQISTANASGDLYVWGFIPVVVAKCGLYLKENATEIPGTFRVNGSSRRMRDLQAEFERPPRYGKSLDWRQGLFTTHDVASVLRRYLTQMPEPVIPHDMYHLFRDTLAKQPFNPEEVISSYKSFIRRLPKANQYLLLYVLDLLSVFARKSDKNLMTAPNLAVIFRPGLISHPQHEMSPQEYALSQSVLEFLIAKQDYFMLDIAPPVEGSSDTIWDPRVTGNTGFEGKWKEATHSREGSRAGTPNVDAEAGPSVQRGLPKNSPQAQAHVQAPLPRHAYNAQFQQSQMQPQPQSQSQQLRSIPQERSHSASRTSGYGSDVDDVMVIPNSDEEYDDDWISPIQGGGGFMSLGGKGKGVLRGEKRTKSMRRRTVVDKSELLPDPTSSDTAQSPAISTTVGVTRSRTLPSRKKGGGDDNLNTDSSSGGKRERSAEKRVLKKQRGVSGATGGGGAIPTVNPTPTAAATTTNVVTRTSG